MMDSLVSDEKGQTRARSAIVLIVTIVVGIIVASVLVPVAIDEIEGDTTTTIAQDTGTTAEVNAELNATLDSVDTSVAPSTATYTLTSDGTSTTKTIDNGTTATYSFDRGDVNVTVQDVTTGSATSEFSYAKDYAYSSGASSLWGILGLTIVLGIFLYVISLATDRL